MNKLDKAIEDAKIAIANGAFSFELPALYGESYEIDFDGEIYVYPIKIWSSGDDLGTSFSQCDFDR